MNQDHRLQPQRFELKYLLDDAITGAIRDFVSCYLDLDDYGVGRPNLSYPVHSLYLDSDDLETFHNTINGTKNRFKLRLRYYDYRTDTPVFFEIKARVDNCILKQRCGVRREAVPLLLAGQLPDPSQLFSKEPRHLVTLQRFNLLLQQLNARPKAHNNYLREAWVSPHDNSVRVTFDRNVRIEPCFSAHAGIEMTNPIRVFPEFTILELKFTGRYPNWFETLVRRFNLMQFSSAKYAEGVVLLGEARFHDGERSLAWQGVTPDPIVADAYAGSAGALAYE
jgi:VTC domain